jgi:hypothetical protein
MFWKGYIVLLTDFFEAQKLIEKGIIALKATISIGILLAAKNRCDRTVKKDLPWSASWRGMAGTVNGNNTLFV